MSVRWALPFFFALHITMGRSGHHDVVRNRMAGYDRFEGIQRHNEGCVLVGIMQISLEDVRDGITGRWMAYHAIRYTGNHHSGSDIGRNVFVLYLPNLLPTSS